MIWTSYRFAALLRYFWQLHTVLHFITPEFSALIIAWLWGSKCCVASGFQWCCSLIDWVILQGTTDAHTVRSLQSLYQDWRKGKQFRALVWYTTYVIMLFIYFYSATPTWNIKNNYTDNQFGNDTSHVSGRILNDFFFMTMTIINCSWAIIYGSSNSNWSLNNVELLYRPKTVFFMCERSLPLLLLLWFTIKSCSWNIIHIVTGSVLYTF